MQKEAVANVISISNQLSTILEVGGGHCQLTDFYLSRGCKVTIQASTDLSLKRAKDLGFSGKVEFNVSPLTPLNFADNSFDLVSGIRLMAHVPDWKVFLSEMLRVSKQGIVFDFANIYTLNILTPILFKLKKGIEKNTRPYHCQSLGEVKNYLESLGCKEITIAPQFVCPMGIHRAIKSKVFSTAIEEVFKAIYLNKLLGSPIIVFAKK